MIECSAIKIKTTNDMSIVIVSLYKPPNNKIISSELVSLLKMEKNAKIIIAGDFNAHSPLWNSYKKCPNGRELENWYLNYKDSFEIQLYATSEPTCLRGNEQSHIDFAFISDKIDVINSTHDKIVPTVMSFSDHSAVLG